MGSFGDIEYMDFAVVDLFEFFGLIDVRKSVDEDQVLGRSQGGPCPDIQHGMVVRERLPVLRVDAECPKIQVKTSGTKSRASDPDSSIALRRYEKS